MVILSLGWGSDEGSLEYTFFIIRTDFVGTIRPKMQEQAKNDLNLNIGPILGTSSFNEKYGSYIKTRVSKG